MFYEVTTQLFKFIDTRIIIKNNKVKNIYTSLPIKIQIKLTYAEKFILDTLVAQ